MNYTGVTQQESRRVDHTADDREYDREIARQERARRARGEDTNRMPVFAVPLAELGEIIESGREEYGRPDMWDTTELSGNPGRVLPPRKTCRSGLHRAGDSVKGECRGCSNLRLRRRRAEKRGSPICWTGEHPQPEPGVVCPCGEPAPDETWCDWVAVDQAVQGQELPRELTPSEELCAMTTIQVYANLGPYEAASALGIEGRRAKYLWTEWQPRTGYKPMTVDELIEEECRDDQTAADTEAPTAA